MRLDPLYHAYMARKRLRLELAKVGLWGSRENATPLTHEDLREVAETFPDTGKAPVALGHRTADFMPAFGWVQGVTFDEEAGVLYGDIELNDLLSEAQDAELYDAWSIGIKRRATDGKKYLHHLAFLGAVPPKIKQLKVLDSQVVYADEADEEWTLLRRTNSHKEDKNMSDSNGRELERLKAELQAKEQQLSDLTKKVEEFADIQARLQEKERQIAEYEARLKETRKQALLDAAKGKVPKEKLALVAVFADSLSPQIELEFADESGAKRKMGAFELLEEIFKAIPMPIPPDQSILSDDGSGNSGAGAGDAAIPMDRL